jgi:hypothetical protein
LGQAAEAVRAKEEKREEQRSRGRKREREEKREGGGGKGIKHNPAVGENLVNFINDQAHRSKFRLRDLETMVLMKRFLNKSKEFCAIVTSRDFMI